MLFISADDFFDKVKSIKRITREEELEYARRMKDGDINAKTFLIMSYLPFAAGAIRHLKKEYQTLELVLRCCRGVERAVTTFNFEQDGETFSHRLSWWLRNIITRYIAEKHGRNAM